MNCRIVTHLKCIVPLLAALLCSTVAFAKPASVVAGNIRVQLLSDSLVRIEQRGPEGFEDRNTFHIVNRDWAGTAFKTNATDAGLDIRTPNFIVRIPTRAESISAVTVESADGEKLFQSDGALTNSVWLPAPSENIKSWSFADIPRLVPPKWGLTPAPANAPRPESSGWDVSNDAPDIYVFVPRGDYRRLRQDFLKLTGPTEMPPLYAFGAYDSRWYDYTEASALQQIDEYRQRKIPLDVLVIDTGWRQNASTGYQPNTNLFPDMHRFFQEAHEKNVRVMFNDHPEPKAKTALAPEELQFRFAGLSGLLNEGLDFWWYDRNWMVALIPPAPSLKKEVWGMRLYHDTTQKVRPESRPLIMANVDGIDNGIRKRPMDVASHRFPIQWTGDIGPGYEYLQHGVENAVFSGVQSLFPYMSEDLGGHTSNPTPEQYIRWIEYGALSPVYRPHCTHNLTRMPWTFGAEAEQVARRYINMRYRLLPVFYAAARENYETGEPLLRRLDLDYPQFPEAARNDEFLLGKGVLVAPVMEGSLKRVPAEWLHTTDGAPGLRAEYFANDNLTGAATLVRTDAAVNFNWEFGSPDAQLPNDHFSARWSGVIDVPASAGDVVLAVKQDDGARVWIDGQPVIDAWGGHDSTVSEAKEILSAGKPHQLRIEYQELTGAASLYLEYRAALTNAATQRRVWLPPGQWTDAWTGHRFDGPAAVTNTVALDTIPIYIKSGTVLPLAPEMQFTGEKPWDRVTLDVYPQSGQSNQAMLYEDDTTTTAYQRGEFRKTAVSASAREDGSVHVSIGAAEGKFHSPLKDRTWVLRIHSDFGGNAPRVKVNGTELRAMILKHLPREASAMPFGDKVGAPDADVWEITLPTRPVLKSCDVEISK